MRQCQVCGIEFESPPGPGRPPKTCSPECHNERKNQLTQRNRQVAADRGCPEHLHGTSTGYTHYLCSCPKCTRWAREYKKQWRKNQPHEGAS